jgi:lycopene beta-cyclase
MQTKRCDILISGGGLAGLSLLYRAMQSGIWQNEQIIVVDQSDKSKNDKTWSFWKNAPSDFDAIIGHQWTTLVFYASNGKRVPLNSKGYTYNSIKSLDFYEYVCSYLRQFTNISFVEEKITGIHAVGDECILKTSDHTYTSRYLFNSVYRKPEIKDGQQYFMQHFKGVRIKTNAVIPELAEAYLMDFRTGQDNGTTFFYTLPVAEDEIFVEYTLFSKSLLPVAAYDQAIKNYLQQVLKIADFEILEEESGVIPMTDYNFKRFEGNIVHLGTAGGDTRASTGYTFTNLQKTIGKVLYTYQTKGHPFFKEENIGIKQQLYDSALLNVLDRKKYPGYQLFSDLFSNCPAYLIFAFLDAETSLVQDLSIMKSLKVVPFLQSFMQVVYRKLRG